MAATVAGRSRRPPADRGRRPRRPFRARQARADRRRRPRSCSPARSPTTSRRWTPGTGCYAALLTNKGKMQADLRVLDTGDELWLDTERVALQALFDMLRRGAVGWQARAAQAHAAAGAALARRPARRATPRAARLGPEHANRARAAGRRRRAARRHRPRHRRVCARRGRRARAAAPSASPASCPRPRPRSLRVESGRPRYGLDLDDATIPQEAGLNERAVSFTKGCYVGQETVARLYYKGKPNRHLRGLRLSAPVPHGHAAAARRARGRAGGLERGVAALRPDRAGARAARGGGRGRARGGLGGRGRG